MCSSDLFLGFLPDHYAAVFLREGRLQRVGPADASYPVQFVAVTRTSPSAPRVARAFLEALRQAHPQPLLPAA